MCGIVGFTGEHQAAPILLDGLSKLEHLNHLLSYQLSHTRKTITIPLIIWTSDTFRRKFLFFFLRWFTTCSIGTSVVMSPEESTMHTIF